jgi:hypothetical protein
MSTKPESFSFVKKQTHTHTHTHAHWHGYVDKLCQSSIALTECIWNLGVLTDTKVHFHKQVDNIFFQAIRLLGIIRTVTFSFSSLTVYCTLVRPRLECASVAWNSVLYSDASKLESIQLKLVSLCYHRFFSHLDYSYGNILNYLKLHDLISRRRYLEVLF